MQINQNIKIAVDAVVFGYKNNKLQTLLVKQKFGIIQGKWCITGGFVLENETLLEAVNRELKEECNIEVDYLEQLYTFGDDINRDPRFRVVSVAYFALVNSTNLVPIADTDAADAQWFDLDKIPSLAYDHDLIIEKAFERIKNKLTYQPIGFDLLPEEFLFSELENLYCTILEKEIDRRNFRKKIMSFGLVGETEKYGSKKSGRPAKLFRFNKEKYAQLEKTGFIFDINFA
jgi:8-oxo-dGTP diphosphatase